jgi:hypothetical protein
LNLFKKILDQLRGLHYSREYLCFAKANFTHTPQLYLISKGLVLRNITDAHLFVGYKPLILAFPNSKETIHENNCHLILSQLIYQPNDQIKKGCPCQACFKKINQTETYTFYEGQTGWHHFLNSFEQKLVSLYNYLYNRKPGNVYLNSSLYKQVQIAYALPRNISLIVLKNGELYNVFPTDLHGSLDDSTYIISLRKGGKALEQVQELGKLLIAEIEASTCSLVFSLGKNHMKPMDSKSLFPLSEQESTAFAWPIPTHCTKWKELVLSQSIPAGIHQLLIFKIMEKSPALDTGQSLYHIHNTYASWRYKRVCRATIYCIKSFILQHLLSLVQWYEESTLI